MAQQDESKYLDEANLYRAIKSNQALSEYSLTLDEIKAVLKAYSDILYTCLRYDIDVALPNMGQFSKKIKKGFQGGYLKKADVPFQKGSPTTLTYYPPKPDYGVITLKIRKSVADRFKEDTLLNGTEKKR